MVTGWSCRPARTPEACEACGYVLAATGSAMPREPARAYRVSGARGAWQALRGAAAGGHTQWFGPSRAVPSVRGWRGGPSPGASPRAQQQGCPQPRAAAVVGVYASPGGRRKALRGPSGLVGTLGRGHAMAGWWVAYGGARVLGGEPRRGGATATARSRRGRRAGRGSQGPSGAVPTPSGRASPAPNKRLQPTADSVRSCVAPASRSG